MNSELLERIIEAVLYEGYILYPYRPSANKNRRGRFTFGRVYPEAFSRAQNGAESCLIQTECLVEARTAPILNVSVRFLQPTSRQIGVFSEPLHKWNGVRPPFTVVPELRVGDDLFQTWMEAVERKIEAPPLELAALNGRWQRVAFEFPCAWNLEPIWDRGQVVGAVRRSQDNLRGTIEMGAQPLGTSAYKVTVRILNHSPVPPDCTDSESVLLRIFASTHTVLHVQDGQFVSLLDPAPAYKPAADACRNLGTWPVLVGNELQAERDTILSSPIILYDYPRLAPESAGPLFDGTEIDELLTLRILTLTDREKSEMRHVDEQARRLLERTERLPDDDLLKMHGTIRAGEADTATACPQPCEPASQPAGAAIDFDDFFGPSTRLQGVSVKGVYLRAGDRIRLCPKGRADAIDMMLAGQVGIIEAVEQDLERRVHLAIVLENDPGKDLGMLRQPGHRFFYGVDEVEPIAAPATGGVER